VLANRPLRTVELAVTGAVVSLVAGRTVLYQPGHLVFFQTSTAHPVGMQITASCTAIFLIPPFFVLAAAMMLSPRLDASRVFLGVLAGSMVVFWLNQFRLLVIAWATHYWGIGQGFDWAHILAGSIVTTVSMMLALYLFFRLSLTHSRTRLPARA
jgi:exosortase/archaeosortase family protein